MKFNQPERGEEGRRGLILAEMRSVCFVIAWFGFIVANPDRLHGSDRTRCFLPTEVDASPMPSEGNSSREVTAETKRRTHESDRPIEAAGVLPTDAVGVDAQSIGGDRSWYRYMEIWKSGLTDTSIRRWFGFPVQDEVQITTRRGRSSPRFVLWAPGSFVVLQTPHFEILSRADANDSERIARDVERLYWVWTQMFFPMWSQRDQVGITTNEWEPDQMPLAEYFSGKGTPRLSSRGRHRVVLLPDAKTYQLTISNPSINAGASSNVLASQGFYSDTLSTSFFYPQESLASLAHEITHQLFEEATDRSRRTQTTATTKDFWLIEGIAGYFESFHAGVQLASLGGWQSDRLQFVRYENLIAGQPIVVLDALMGNRLAIQRRDRLSQWYSQSILHTHFAMDSFADGSRRASRRASLLKRIADVYRVDVSDFPSLNSADPTWSDDAMHRFLRVDDLTITENPPYADAVSLCLAGCEVTETGWRSIPPLPLVKWFDGSRTPLTGEQATRILSQSTQIEQLSLEATKVNHEIASTIANQKQLRELDLSWTAVDDATIARLRECPLIETLWLTGTAISDESMDTLASLVHLKTIDVQRTRITESGLDQLRKSMPNLEINPLELN